MATNWADPLHLKSRFLSKIPGMNAMDHFAEDNAFGRILTEGPVAALPREYQIQSPWAGMQFDKDQAAQNKNKQLATAYGAIANSPDQPQTMMINGIPYGGQ